jgi:DNA-damage-inducible protein D
LSSIIPPNATSPFERIKQTSPDGVEYWSARDLQAEMGYDRWERFTDAMERAMAAALNAGSEPLDHFRGAAKMVPIGSNAHREVVDFHLTRFGAYLTAMNGDPRKPEIAAAQTYFAVQTRKAETAPAAPALPQDYEEALVALLGQVRETKALTARVAELEPAANSWQTLAAADGDFSVGDAAKILARDPAIKLGRNRLFTLLDEFRWTYRQLADDRPRVMQAAIERQWLSEIPQSHYHPRSGELVMDAPQVRVTVKGLHELHKRLGGTAAVAIPAVPMQGGAR